MGVRLSHAVAFVIGVSVIVAGITVARPPVAEPNSATAALGPSYRFVSTPDLFNADIGDLRNRGNWADYKRQWQRRFPHQRVPNSWNGHHRRQLDQIFDAFEAEDVDDVLVAGDMVGGHWGFDKYFLPDGRRVKTRAFGPTRTWKQQKRAARRAARFYFREYRRYFGARGMRVWPAIGDHELGDNPWSGTQRHRRLTRATIPVVRQQFKRQFVAPHQTKGRIHSRPWGPTRPSAYASYLHDDVLLVTLDEFIRKEHRNRVVPKVDRRQLAWLDRVLAEANRRGTDWIIVQGHLPIVPNVRLSHSSGMCYRGGTSSALWQVLRKHRVDLYLNGEVHDNSRNTVDGITQISHGGLYGQWGNRGNTSYLVGEVYGDRLELTLKRFQIDDTTGKPFVWQTTPKQKVTHRKVLEPTPKVLGTLSLHKDNRETWRGSTGVLTPYRGDQRCGHRDGVPHENL